MDLDLSGRHALVCGASEGIGRAAAQELALLGADVTVLARRADVLEQVAAALPRRDGQRHGFVAADVALTRGETLFARGRLHEALLALDAVPSGDPLRARADEITSAIQKQLLAAARGAEAGPEPTTRRP